MKLRKWLLRGSIVCLILSLVFSFIFVGIFANIMKTVITIALIVFAVKMLKKVDVVRSWVAILLFIISLHLLLYGLMGMYFNRMVEPIKNLANQKNELILDEVQTDSEPEDMVVDDEEYYEDYEEVPVMEVEDVDDDEKVSDKETVVIEKVVEVPKVVEKVVTKEVVKEVPVQTPAQGITTDTTTSVPTNTPTNTSSVNGNYNYTGDPTANGYNSYTSSYNYTGDPTGQTSNYYSNNVTIKGSKTVANGDSEDYTISGVSSINLSKLDLPEGVTAKKISNNKVRLTFEDCWVGTYSIGYGNAVINVKVTK